jgi:hydrogenase maturation factor
VSCSDEHCITCGDQGIPMRVASVSDPGEATCLDRDEQEHTVITELVEPVNPGDEVLVHAGVAIGRI